MKKEKKVRSEKSKRRRKIAGRVFLLILIAIVLFVLVTVMITVIGDKATMKKVESIKPVSYDSQLVPTKDTDGNWTFTTDKELKILHLTDVHIGAGWMSLKKDAMSINAVASMVTAEKPDLVVVTGDIAYPVPFQAGTFNNKTPAKIFANLMENLGVYWTMTMGNHDTELYSYFNREAIGDFYENSGFKYCLFQLGPTDVDGTGNQIIKVKNSKGLITQALYTFDSHSYTDGDFLGIMWKYDNIHQNQVDWYSNTLDKLNKENDDLMKHNQSGKSDIKSLAFFHIPLTEQKDAWHEYRDNGFKDTENVKLVAGVVGEGSKEVFPGCHNDELFETMLKKGSTKGVFFGHDHENNVCFDYKGIRLTYGMSIDYLAYPGIYKLGSQRGCNVILVEPDGTYTNKLESYYQAKYTSPFKKEQVTMQEMHNEDPAK